jgi:glycerophosphoryl diester phosphodiesterase
MIRVGHRGADAIVRGNTLASFDAALDAGVEMIEFDVLSEDPDGGGRLLVVHDYGVLRAHGAPNLTEVLAHLAQPQFATIRLQLDIKRQGYEERVLAALREASLVQRAFISSGEWRTLERIRAADPSVRIGWTVPAGPAAVPLLGRAVAWISAATLARVAGDRIRSGAIDALVPQWQLVTPRLVRSVLAAGGEVYVWTVDDAARISRLASLGVTGVITNDPRLFS